MGQVKGEVVQTGNPIRDGVRAARKPFDPPGADGTINVLVFGGSQGASLFSRVLPEALATLPETVRRRLHVTQQARDEEKDRVAEVYANAEIEATLAPFFADLPARMADSHLVVARSGASSVTELAVLGRPSLLIPLGIAMDDHQRANAEVLEAAGAADVLLEAGFTVDAASASLEGLLGEEGRLARMADAATGRMPDDAAGRLADLCERLLEAPLPKT
nr:glycosyltransferase [Parvularcula dongshanensis]